MVDSESVSSPTSLTLDTLSKECHRATTALRDFPRRNLSEQTFLAPAMSPVRFSTLFFRVSPVGLAPPAPRNEEFSPCHSAHEPLGISTQTVRPTCIRWAALLSFIPAFTAFVCKAMTHCGTLPTPESDSRTGSRPRGRRTKIWRGLGIEGKHSELFHHEPLARTELKFHSSERAVNVAGSRKTRVWARRGTGGRGTIGEGWHDENQGE